MEGIFCQPRSKERTGPGDLKSSVLECDYDSDATHLYQAIESEAWVPLMQFLDTGKWEHMYLKDPHSPERQARTWVTRFEEDGTVRWSQLPLHAAFIFNAPKKVITSLIALYPLSVRCTDDQQMLPLHLAFKFGAEDSVITTLLERFPEALFTKNNRGKIPTDVEGPRMERIAMILQVISITTKHVNVKQGKFYQEMMAELKDDLNLQTRLNASLECDKSGLEEHLARVCAENATLQTECKLLKGQKSIADAPKWTAPTTIEKLNGDDARSDLETRQNNDGSVDPRRSAMYPVKKVSDKTMKLSYSPQSSNSGPATSTLAAMNTSKSTIIDVLKNDKPRPEAKLKAQAGRSGRRSPLQHFITETAPQPATRDRKLRRHLPH